MMYKGLIQKFVARIGIEPTCFRCVGPPTDALPTELPETLKKEKILITYIHFHHLQKIYCAAEEVDDLEWM